jgi:hypothetical protein
MINENLHRKPAALDRIRHRRTRLDTNARELSALRTMSAFFVASVEFGDACKDFPLVWIRAGKDDKGKDQVAPVAVFGLGPGENLCIEDDAWRVRYVPVALRLYPFAMARVSPGEMVVCVDESWAGLSDGGAGEALFDADGKATAFTQTIHRQLEQFEGDVERTRQAGAMLLEHDLLRDMRFDATMPDGSKVSADGFLTVDDAKLNALTDAQIVTLTRNGLMAMIHAHQISLGNMARLAEWHSQRQAAQAPAQA